jgi:hypothetical protein
LVKRGCFSDKCNTFKSCAIVFLIAAAIAGSLLIIRLVGERRLQNLLNMLLSHKRKEPDMDLVSESFAPENRI